MRWMHKRHVTQKQRQKGRFVLLAGYFGCALIAALSGLVAFQSEPAAASGWVYGICAVVFGFSAFICLAREDTVKVAATVGDDWLARINRSER